MRQLSLVSALAFFAAALAAPPVLADAIDDLMPGQWYEVPNSRLDALDPCPMRDCSYSGAEGVAATMDDWSGGAFDTSRSRLLIWGGGHGGYAGNEIYAFDLPTLAWVLIDEPSDPPGIDVPYAADGGPTSRHSYDYIQYVPALDALCSVGGAGFYVSGQTGTNHTDCYDFGANVWKKKADALNAGDNRIGSISAFDTSSNLLFSHSTYVGRLASYDPANDAWKQYGDDVYLDYSYTAAVDPKRHKFVAAGDSSGGDPSLLGKLLVWDIGDPGAATIGVQPIATSGDQSVLSAASPGLDYDPVSDRIVAWIGGSDIYVLDMDTMSWEKRAATNGVTPTARNMNGTFGRFRYAASKNVFVLANRTSDNVFVYRLAPGGGTGPSSASASAGTGASAGPSASSAATAGSGGAITTSGAGGAGIADRPSSDSGCSCASTSSTRAPAAAWLAIAALLGLTVARRDRRRRRSSSPFGS